MSRIEPQKRKKVSMPLILIGLVVSILLVSSSLYFLLYPFPSEEKVTYFTEEHPIIYKGITNGEAVVINSEVYLPLSFVHENIDEGITYDEASSSVILTTRNKVVQMPADALSLFVNEQPVNLEIPATTLKNGEVFISYSAIQSYYPFEVTVLSETGAVLVRKDGDSFALGNVSLSENAHEKRLRKEPIMTAPYTAEVSQGEIVTIEKEDSNFYFVRKQNGIAGFIQKKQVVMEGTETVIVKWEEDKRFSPSISWPINLTWEAVYTENPDTSKLPPLTGVNVVSPTWFKIKNEQGEIANLASMEYVNWAKIQNLQIWGLFSNDFNPELTHTVLQSYETRMNMIRQILQYSQMYQLNGINIDFENVKTEDGKLVTQFVKELTPYLHQAGLTVSMDITFISESEMWSKFYERDQLAGIVDYMIVMAYDEHWGTSPKAGSVASFPWVESNLKNLLEVIPHDRLILGLPTYTRIWKEQDTEGGNIEVSSKAYSMDYLKEWLVEHKLVPVFDEVSGQQYAEYRDEQEKATYKVWIEDADSLSRRSQLVHHYQLAGVGTWSRYFASNEAWGAIDESLKHRK
ncbi:glycosyl hydrolase family 18 protein [Bacillus sp. DJP31]|uniref:glycosyl hydrolase family 18 protein n=1 Tax=Bacillus sp. DJP31 TaxID=3409789 RepID=UPI003BB4EAA3